MISKYALLLPILAFASTIFAQDNAVYKWDPKPHLHKIPTDDTGQSAVIIQDDVNIEYRQELDHMYIYRSVHRIVRVLDDKGIEAFNKITIPISSGKTIEFIKARTILPSGKVIEVGRDNMKTIKDEDGNSEYLFAMEGVEKNSEVELQYTERKPLSFFGGEIQQFGIPVLHSTFVLRVPKKLIFKTKTYNGYPPIHDTLIDDTRYYKTSMNNVPAIHDEAYANESAMQMRVEYKIEYLPEDNPDLRILTWNDLAKQLAKEFYNIDKREERATAKFLTDIGVNKSDDDGDKIHKIEDAIKTNIVLNKQLDGDDINNINNILGHRTADEQGMTRLFVACFTLAGVKHEVGISSNRYDHPVDPKFENWRYLDNYVFYFPRLDGYMSPQAIFERYPVVPSGLLTNTGIFCKINADGSIAAMADIRKIEPLPAKESHNDIDANITFTGDDMTPQIEDTYSLLGYCAMGVRELMVVLPKDKKLTAVKNIFSIAGSPADITTYKTANSAFHNYYYKRPLKISVSIKVPQLIENAGPKYLFKVGEVIGQQVELYQDDKRKLPIVLEYPHEEDRTITINIPDGYKIVNPDAVRLHTDDKKMNGGKASMGFDSDYKITGNKMVINIHEFYYKLHYPVSYYPTYRKVINSSADFNKVVLVLAKK